MIDTFRGLALAALVVGLVALALAGRWLLYGHLLPGGVLTGLLL